MKTGRFYILFILLYFVSVRSLAQLTYKELEVLYDSAWTYKNLQLIPVKFKPLPAGAAIVKPFSEHPLSLTEAMQKHKIKVQEMQYENGADINWLQVTNQSKQDVVVQSGEIMEGGKQDRMVGETKVIAAGTTDYLNVFCVEKRRWDDKAKAFKTKGMANSEVRKAMDVKGRQADVWKEIDRQFSAQKKESLTLSYLHLYNDIAVLDTSYLNYFKGRYYGSNSNYSGFIFITGNRIISTELFGSKSLLDLSFINMLKSYIETAITTGAPPVLEKAKINNFMDKILASEDEQKNYVTAHGKLHKTGNRVIHLIAYPE
jgi:hypothetical protein